VAHSACFATIATQFMSDAVQMHTRNITGCEVWARSLHTAAAARNLALSGKRGWGWAIKLVRKLCALCAGYAYVPMRAI
jgi:hypothetical protein